MNILVTGANGQLGRSLQQAVKHSSDHYIFTDVCDGYDRLDITDFSAVQNKVRQERVECIINCAAWTDVDGAETAGTIVEQLNTVAPENLALAMKDVNGLLVHISTDYVFGVEPYNTPCKEERKGTPTGVYGLTKLHGEQRIVSSGANYIIIRTAWLYSEYGKNFVKTMLNMTTSKPQIKVVFDQCGTPTYALDLAEAIFEIVEKRLYVENTGVYNYTNEGVCSWFDFAKMISKFAKTTCEILPCHSNEFPTPVRRPSYSVLDKTKIKETFGLRVPYWTDSLERCIANILSKNEKKV